MGNAVAYARFSSDNQRAQSIDEQLREIKEYANRKGFHIIKEYCDYAITGSTQDREQYMKLLQDSEKGFLDTALVFDYTRFSRGGEDGIFDMIILKRNKVRLISITEDYGEDTFGTKLIKYVKFLNAEDDLVKLKNNVMRGHKENAVHAKHNGGKAALGYDICPDTMKYIINEHEAKAVRLIFEMKANGSTYAEIASKLNALGYKTKSCKPNKENPEQPPKKNPSGRFRKNSLIDILQNQTPKSERPAL